MASSTTTMLAAAADRLTAPPREKPDVLRERARKALAQADRLQAAAHVNQIQAELWEDHERAARALDAARGVAAGASQRARDAEGVAAPMRSNVQSLRASLDALASVAGDLTGDREARKQARRDMWEMREELAGQEPLTAEAEERAAAAALASQIADNDVDAAEARLRDIDKAIRHPFSHPLAMQTKWWKLWALIGWEAVIADPRAYPPQRRVVAWQQLQAVLGTEIGQGAAIELEHRLRDTKATALMRDENGELAFLQVGMNVSAGAASTVPTRFQELDDAGNDPVTHGATLHQGIPTEGSADIGGVNPAGG